MAGNLNIIIFVFIIILFVGIWISAEMNTLAAKKKSQGHLIEIAKLSKKVDRLEEQIIDKDLEIRKLNRVSSELNTTQRKLMEAETRARKALENYQSAIEAMRSSRDKAKKLEHADTPLSRIIVKTTDKFFKDDKNPPISAKAKEKLNRIKKKMA